MGADGGGFRAVRRAQSAATAVTAAGPHSQPCLLEHRWQWGSAARGAAPGGAAADTQRARDAAGSNLDAGGLIQMPYPGMDRGVASLS